MHLTSSKALTEQFNWHLKDNLLLFADEAIFAGAKQDVSTIKGLITEPTRQLRKLYADEITVPNYTRVILASNEDWMIPSDIDDRRFFVLDVGSGRQRDRESAIAALALLAVSVSGDGVLSKAGIVSGLFSG